MDINQFKEETDSSKRYRNWAFIMYPDSCPGNWRNIFEELQIPCVVSPLHDKDVNELDFEQKKPHYHVILSFEGKKSRCQVEDIAKNLFCGTVPQPVHSLKGACRYLTHMDNPDKFQYSSKDVSIFAGFDYDAYTSFVTSSVRYELISDMMDFVIEADITSYTELMLYAKENCYDWFQILCDNSSYCLVQFIKDRRYYTLKQYSIHHHEKEDKTNDRL